MRLMIILMYWFHGFILSVVWLFTLNVIYCVSILWISFSFFPDNSLNTSTVKYHSLRSRWPVAFMFLHEKSWSAHLSKSIIDTWFFVFTSTLAVGLWSSPWIIHRVSSSYAWFRSWDAKWVCSVMSALLYTLSKWTHSIQGYLNHHSTVSIIWGTRLIHASFNFCSSIASLITAHLVWIVWARLVVIFHSLVIAHLRHFATWVISITTHK
jgi:hypothetical protein